MKIAVESENGAELIIFWSENRLFWFENVLGFQEARGTSSPNNLSWTEYPPVISFIFTATKPFDQFMWP